MDLSTRTELITLVVLLGCPGDDKTSVDDTGETCVDGYVVYVVHEVVEACGTACPEGAFEGYTDGEFLVCNECRDEADCETGEVCSALCGPGCEDDTEGGCCPVYACASAGSGRRAGGRCRQRAEPAVYFRLLSCPAPAASP